MDLNIGRELTRARGQPRGKRKLSVTPLRCRDRRLVHCPYGADSLGGVGGELARLSARRNRCRAEKMRALLQTQQKLLARGWNRPRARDYYDLWRILRDFGPSLKGVELSDLLKRKSGHRGVSYGSLDDFFTAELEAEARRNWDGNLRPFVPELPACDDVLAELKQILPDFFPNLIDRR